ncbi:MAG: integrase arm-type DNA-binding domain-containing protein [Pseudomonadota bacterium]
MALTIHRLTVAGAKNATKPLCDGGGLWVYPIKEDRYWIFRYKLNGNEREMSLGNILDKSLKEARREASEYRKLKSQGIDPIEHRQQKKQQIKLDAAKGMKFDSCATAYVNAHQAGWKNPKHVDQWRNTLKTYASPVIGDLPVASVDTGLVLKILEPIWTKKTETASRLRGRIENILDWATVRGYRTGDNPARWRGHLDKTLPKRSKVQKVRHHPALPYAEIGEFMEKLRSRQGLAARALELTIYTTARTNEVIASTWDEFDLANAIWTIPGDRMKSGRDHRVPLTEPVLAILKKLPEAGDFVFPGQRYGKHLSNTAMLKVLKDDLGYANLTVHGFRSSFRDWAAEMTAYPRELAEAQLAHVLSDKTEAAYQRGDMFEKRRRMLDDWSKFCATRPETTVIPLRGRRKSKARNKI